MPQCPVVVIKQLSVPTHGLTFHRPKKIPASSSWMLIFSRFQPPYLRAGIEGDNRQPWLGTGSRSVRQHCVCKTEREGEGWFKEVRGLFFFLLIDAAQSSPERRRYLIRAPSRGSKPLARLPNCRPTNLKKKTLIRIRYKLGDCCCCM